MNNTLSIITPSLNQGKFIKQTINSVLSQSGDFYIDYIIADGGSIDDSVEIIKKYDQLLEDKKYPVKCRGIKYRWWSRPDNGQSHAINQGFRIAKGDILAWINSDDYYAEDTFDFVIKKFQENSNIDLIYGNCYEIFKSGEIRKGEVIWGDFKKNLNEGCSISQPAAFFTKKVLKTAGYLDESFKYCMDYDLWLKILKNSKSLYTQKHLAYFRIWPHSKTSQYNDGFRMEDDLIRKKYSGSRINPVIIHRLRCKIPLIKFIKKKFPFLYYFIKNLLYSIVNKVKF
jgi:glycosyltransferase involved in cell wall biosynthesis